MRHIWPQALRCSLIWLNLRADSSIFCIALARLFNSHLPFRPYCPLLLDLLTGQIVLTRAASGGRLRLR